MDIKLSYDLPEDAVLIRTEVFVEEQGFTEEFDSDDKTALHLVGYENGIAVATGRILKRDDKAFFIGRIAVRKSFRGKHLGSEIVFAAEKHIKALGGKEILIHSQMQAAPFYEAIGYLPTGDYDEEEGCPHCMMKKSI